MNHLWNELVDRLNPYVPGEQPITVKLNTNENPYGPSPKVFEAIHAECTAMLRLYPSREALAKSLKALGFEVLPSSANFLFARHPRHDARHLASALQERSIFVRHIPYPRIEQYLRITVGTDSDCTALLSALRELTCS